eukprot:7340338-Ditylum_brightwellii.AAC.1
MRGSVVMHKFSQKYRFNGSWDTTGMMVVQSINCHNQRYNRSANANDCYEKLGRDLPKNSDEKETQKWLENEQIYSTKVLDNTLLNLQQIPRESGWIGE